MSRPLTVGAMFAGYGGLEMGLSQVLDARPAWFAEYEAAPSHVLAHHWPNVPNHGDVTKVNWSAVEPVDVITGGSPCQDLSHAGKRAGMKAGTRSGLWASMCDAIDIIRPRLVVWENVRGALSAEADSGMEPCPGCVGGGDDGPVLRALGRVLGDLADIGYDAAWTGLRAADVGACHGRFRVFVLAWPATDAGGETLGLGAGLRASEPGRLGRGRPDDDPVSRRDGAPALTLLPTPAVNDMGASYTPETWDAWTARMKAAHGNGNGHGASLHIEAQRMLPTPGAWLGEHRRDQGQPPERRRAGGHQVSIADVACHELRMLPTPTATDANASGGAVGSSDVTLTDATVRADLRGISWGDYAPAIARWEAALGSRAPAPTEPTGKGGAHRLSADFVEWMMGLPAGWTDVPGVSRNDRLKALGNGVVPQQAAAAVRHLLDVRAAHAEAA